jgi:hypothetical protein
VTNIDNNIANIIVRVLKKNKEGLTITALSEKIKLNRFVTRLNLARLEGANKVNMRRIGMAKLYTVRK